MKKQLSLLLFSILLMLVVVPLSPVSAERALHLYLPSDIENHWAYDELDDFVNADILYGYTDAEGNVLIKPNQRITRAEFVTILVRSLNLKSNGEGKMFTDVPEGKWFTDSIKTASSLSIIDGVSETTFAPHQNIKRDEIAKIISNAFVESINFNGEAKSFNDVPDYWGTPFIEKVSSVGIVSGYPNGSFKPRNNATRAEAVMMLYNAFNLEDSNLPDADYLTNMVLEKETLGMEYFNNQQFEELQALEEDYLMGYYLAYSKEQYNEYLNMIDQGFTITIAPIQEYTADLIFSSNHFASVEISNFIVEVEIFGPEGYHTTYTQDLSGIALLKKVSNENVWKKYHYFLTAEEQ